MESLYEKLVEHDFLQARKALDILETDAIYASNPDEAALIHKSILNILEGLKGKYWDWGVFHPLIPEDTLKLYFV